MKPQNYQNHRRIVYLYHGITFLAIIALGIGSVINLLSSTRENLYSASLLVLLSFIQLSFFFYARIFPLRAQDRAIRAEENLRHYVLAGKLLDPRLGVRQIVALRFASDGELPALAKKAAQEQMTADAIKKSIKDWRPDTYRV